MARRWHRVLPVLVAAACSQTPSAPPVPLLVQVRQAQTVPSFAHVILKVFADDGGRPGGLVSSSGCVSTSGLPTSGGRRRLSVAVPAERLYYLQLTGHTDATCTAAEAVAVGVATRVSTAAGRSTSAPIFLAPVERWTTINPVAIDGAQVVPRAFHTATVTERGDLLVAGGAQEVAALGSAACAPGLGRCLRLGRATSGIHRFDPASGATILVGTLAERRFLHTSTALGGGLLAVAGGAQAATVGAAGPASDAPLVRAEPECTNPNDSGGSGCILGSIEVHDAQSFPLSASPRRIDLLGARAVHAALRVGSQRVLVAGGRRSAVQRGCSTDAQCAPGASCDAQGRCLRGGEDCLGAASASEVCPAGYRCEATGADAGKCLKDGCATDEDCGGCLASGGCSDAPSTCNTETGVCTRRGCGSDSECLGSHRRCEQGNCVQVGCDALSGCPAGRTCDVRTGKCAPAGASVDCSQGGACDCGSDADCAVGFTCQTTGEHAGRCRAQARGCPGTICRRDVDDPSQGPYFDPVTGRLRSEVNCDGGQCVLQGCLGDVDCRPGFLCDRGLCVNGRRVTRATRSVEVCDLGASGGCASAADLGAAREGAVAACAVRDPGPECSQVLIWGGNSDPAHAAELRAPDGSTLGEVSLPGCAAPGACTFSFSALAESGAGVTAVGGAAFSGGGSQYRFLTVGYRVGSSAPSTAQLLTAQLTTPRAFAAAVPLDDGLLVVGGADGALTSVSTTGRFDSLGATYEEPMELRLERARFGHTASVLPDGRLVVIGGIDTATLEVLGSIEIFVPRASLR